MPNIITTNIDRGPLILEGRSFAEELLTFAGAATAKAGTILARDSVTEKLVLFVKGGTTDGNGIPKAVLTYEVVATGPGDRLVRVLTQGKLAKKRMVIHADGDDSAIDGAVLDQLRSYGITAEVIQELNYYDNPAS